MTNLSKTVTDRLSVLPPGLIRHIEHTRELAMELASIHCVDVEASDTGAACHDLFRAETPHTLRNMAVNYGIYIHPVYETLPMLLHGTVAAQWIQEEVGISDKRIIEAVRYHSIGKRDMGQVGRIVFIADKLEPGKRQREKQLDTILEITKNNLDAGIKRYIDTKIGYHLAKGNVIHPATMEFRNDLLVSQTEHC